MNTNGATYPDAAIANGLDREALLPPEAIQHIRGRSVGYMAKERSAGRGPRYYKDGQLIRYRLGDVLAWMEARQVGTADQPAHRRDA